MKRRSQRGKNLGLKASRLSSWDRPLSESSARRSSSCSADSWVSGASREAKGAKLSETRSIPCSRAHAIVSQISHSLKPFGVDVRSGGIDESERAEAAR